MSPSARRTRTPIHPILFGLWPVAAFLGRQVGGAATASILQAGMVLLLVVVGNYLAWRLLVRDSFRAAMAASATILVFLSFPLWQEILSFLLGWAGDVHRGRVVVPIAAAVLVAAVVVILRTRRDLRTPNRLLDVVAAVTLLAAIGEASAHALKAVNRTRDLEAMLQEVREESPSRPVPNIYYIVVDGYASAETLAELYDFNNEPFLSALEDAGFHVVDRARSNYSMSFLALASSLNARLLQDGDYPADQGSLDRSIPYALIQNGWVPSVLRQRGYTLVHMRSGWGPTDDGRYADEIIDCGGWRTVVTRFAETTMLAPGFNRLAFLTDWERRLVSCQLNRLAQAPGVSTPHFLFAHLVTPHPPFIFGPNGEPRPDDMPEDPGSGWSGRQRYVDQLVFVNAQLRRIVDAIAVRDPGAITIVHSDHGPGATLTPRAWHAPTTEFLRERMRNFIAIRWPGHRDQLAVVKTPVNIFVPILNGLFGLGLDLRPDRSLFSDYRKPFAWIDVTDVVSKP